MKLYPSTLDVPPAERPRNRRRQGSREGLLTRIRGEFAEMPCLSLTMAQSMRLFALRADICQRVLDTLVAERVLSCRGDGRYVLRERVTTQPAVTA
jgi:hypothetical protein